jgi:hypothetical protein
MDAQKRLFDIIKSLIPESHRLADVIGDLLNVSADAAYRRIRGEKGLTFLEAQKLCGHFHLSMDDLLKMEPSGQTAMFHYVSVDMSDPASYLRYIERLLNTLTALKQVEDRELFFTAQDIPFYHFLNHTELLFFKLYVWHDIVHSERIPFREFCDRLDRNAILPIYKQMYQAYMQIPSKEIWTNQTVDTILRLLDFYMETGAFDTKETVFHLLSQLSQLLDTVNAFALNGHKGDPLQTPFVIYSCSVDLENNFMLTRRGNRWVCTIKLYTVNSISTDHPALCGETEKWIRDLIHKSTLISGGTAERERFRFFQTSKNKIEELANKIEKMQWL